MDANKLKVLRGLPYVIHPCCEMCVHAELMLTGWGYCNANEYVHLKHSEPSSRLSINRMGSCHKWTRDDVKVRQLGLGQYVEFMK
jgi:hypothetical protein